jgi:hypothetical protein
MDAAVLREKLHEYINIADEQRLSAIYILVKENIRSSVKEKYDEETMNELYRRREDHRAGKSLSYTMEESFDMARRAKK